jgi:hypothetical protein
MTDNCRYISGLGRLSSAPAWEGSFHRFRYPRGGGFRTLPHAITSQSRPRARDAFALKAIVPAFNEAATVADTIRSLLVLRRPLLVNEKGH